MAMGMREDADHIISESIKAVLPNEAVQRALLDRDFGSGRLFVVAAGKAAWQMAKAAADILGERYTAGVVCTKYHHVLGDIPRMCTFEGGHPVPDKNSFLGTQAAIDMVSDLMPEDTVLFLLSGGGSALFESSLVSLDELQEITSELLASGADITEINTIRKRLSAVKGGRFAKICEPAHVLSIILSDILGDPLDMIASGPTVSDMSTCDDAFGVVKKYGLHVSEHVLDLLGKETPKELHNVENMVTGSVKNLCMAARLAAQSLGYDAYILTDLLDCEAKDAGAFLGAVAKSHQDAPQSLALIAGGETVVHLMGHGKGGRNQELALAAAEKIAGCTNTAVFSVGSDGTDGPTDAAGGYVDGATRDVLYSQGLLIPEVLLQNDAYHALKAAGGLIVTGPTGTNVNDVSVVLIRR